MAKENYTEQENTEKPDYMEDLKISREFEILVDDQKLKVESEEQVRRSLWGLDILLKNKEVTRDMAFRELSRIVGSRISELRRTIEHSKNIPPAGPDDKVGKEFHEIALKDLEKSKKELTYIEALGVKLQRMNNLMLDQMMPISEIQRLFKEELDRKEGVLDQNLNSKFK